MSIIKNVRGNSPAAIAGRAGNVVRRANAWKVTTGLITRKYLRRWVRQIERAALDRPGDFAGWAGVVKK